MIIVIADDFTGAGEIAGLGLRYGLRTELQTDFGTSCDAELLVVDTNTRSIDAVEAAEKVKEVCYGIKPLQPELIYNKVDSVLRGNVLAELEASLFVLDMDRAILLPANPSMGRTIRDGRYFINSRPLEETDFASDPEHPAHTSDVLELLGDSESSNIYFQQIPQPVPHGAIAVGQIKHKQSLLEWAAEVDEQTLPAGGADFFAAILQQKGIKQQTGKEKLSLESKKKFFVCTSSSEYSRSIVHKLRSRAVVISQLPSEMLKPGNDNGEVLSRWIDNTAGALNMHDMVVASIEKPAVYDRSLAAFLCDCTVSLIENVLSKTKVDELIIEGGATASAAVRRLGFNNFFPCSELARGVVRMKIEHRNLYLTVKPGSYHWPGKLLNGKM